MSLSVEVLTADQQRSRLTVALLMGFNISYWQLAFGVVYCVIAGPPIHIYRFISRFYKRQARLIKAKTPLLPAAERKRQAHEEMNTTHPFMRLPGELRNRIYSYCMVSDTVIDPIWGTLSTLEKFPSTDTTAEFYLKSNHRGEYMSRLYYEDNYDPYEVTWAKMANMSQVCRAWRVEALKHFYGSNVFKLSVGQHLHQRRGPARRAWYFRWPVWVIWYWERNVASQPAGPFALRQYYVHWLQKRPREAFSVMRLVLHDYRHCPHWVRQHSVQSLNGSCLILVDFRERQVRAVRGMESHRDFFNLWDCNDCWTEFVENVDRLNGNEEIVKLFAAFHIRLDASAAIEVVDGVRRNLKSKYDAQQVVCIA